MQLFKIQGQADHFQTCLTWVRSAREPLWTLPMLMSHWKLNYRVPKMQPFVIRVIPTIPCAWMLSSVGCSRYNAENVRGFMLSAWFMSEEPTISDKSCLKSCVLPLLTIYYRAYRLYWLLDYMIIWLHWLYTVDPLFCNSTFCNLESGA